jgi:putative FmdB family regulatory protein
MPTYIHKCTDEECNHEWDDFYSITEDPPKTCPKCGKETAKRLIYGGSGKGVVVLTGRELTNKIKQDARNMLKQSQKDENIIANIVGEEKYHKNMCGK